MSTNRMRPFKALMSRDQALAALLAASEPVDGVEDLPLARAVGRVLVEDARAPLDVPGFTRSAMDGYAVRASDTWGAARLEPKPLRVVATVHAGEVAARGVGPGEAIQVATGGKLPAGADAVVRVEDTTRRDEDVVLVAAPVPPMANVSKRGSDIRRGEIVLRSGETLNPARVGILASLGVSGVRCRRRVRAAVVPTGNEIAEPGATLRDGQVYNSNAYALEGLLSEHGADVRRLPVIADTVEAHEEALVKTTADADIVVLSGGSSVGERDILVDVLREHGEVLVHGVQVKPGKPLLVGVLPAGARGRRVVVGLPGYPTSCLTNAYVFVLPALRRLAHLPELPRRSVRAPMGEKVVSNLGRYQVLPVSLRDGKVHSTFKESGALTSIAHADGYIGIPDNVDLVEEGDEVEVHLW